MQNVFIPGEFVFWFRQEGESTQFYMRYRDALQKGYEVHNDIMSAKCIQKGMNELIETYNKEKF